MNLIKTISELKFTNKPETLHQQYKINYIHELFPFSVINFNIY